MIMLILCAGLLAGALCVGAWSLFFPTADFTVDLQLEAKTAPRGERLLAAGNFVDLTWKTDRARCVGRVPIGRASFTPEMRTEAAHTIYSTRPGAIAVGAEIRSRADNRVLARGCGATRLQAESPNIVVVRLMELGTFEPL